MGQVFVPAIKDIILTDVDRLVARNSDGGISPLAAHIILLGEAAGQNLGDLDGIIALGAFSLDAGLADTQLQGTIAIGLRAASAVTSGTNNDDATSDSVVIGQDAARDTQFLSGCVILGGEALKRYVGDTATAGAERSVIIGNEACENVTGTAQFTSNTLIGWRVARGVTGSMASNVFVGDRIAQASTVALNGNTVVGASAAIAMGSGGINAASSNVIIGQGAAPTLDFGDNNVVVGQAASLTAGGATEQSDDVLIGCASVAYGGKHTVIGKGATTSSFGAVGARSIIIGYQAGQTLGGGTTDLLILETFDGGITRAGLFGDLTKGVIILGNSQIGVDRDTGGAGATNLVKILNGTTGAAAPAGGLFLLSVAGDLRMQAPGPVERIITGVFTVATLPAAAGRAGSRAFVTDALAPAFQVAVAGGGAVFTPVYCDGVGWFVG